MKSNLIIAGDDLNCSKKIYNTIKMKNLDVEVIGITTDGEETFLIYINCNVLKVVCYDTYIQVYLSMCNLITYTHRRKIIKLSRYFYNFLSS